jgi:hypothetical protein
MKKWFTYNTCITYIKSANIIWNDPIKKTCDQQIKLDII